jgi:hypothetical protein
MSLTTILCILAVSMSGLVSAKDDLVTFDQCPPAVKQVIQQYSVKYKLETIGYDKTTGGGPPRYEVKFTGGDGKRFEVHISLEGKVLEIEPKKPKL